MFKALKLYNKKLFDINVIFRSLKVKNLHLGKMIAFEIENDEENEGIAFYVSENIQEELGYSIEDFYLNLQIKDLISENEFRKIIASFEQNIKANKKDFSCEFKMFTKNGNPIWCYSYNHIKYDSEPNDSLKIKKKWKIVSGYILDISERKARETKIEHTSNKINLINKSLEERVKIEAKKLVGMEQQLELAKRHSAMSETLEKIAHQWRQPLNIIALIMQDFYFKVNLGEFDMQEESKNKIYFKDFSNDVYEKVNTQIQYISSTIDDFRKNLKEDAEQEKEYFNIYELFEEVIEMLKIPLTLENIFVTVDYELSYYEIYGTKGNLKQVLLNLFNNAKDIFIERKIFEKQIQVTFEINENNHLCISICDNAGGIDSDITEKIFDPYFTTRKETKGTGLGLYMSKEIMNRYFSGNLLVKNRDNGACFVISTKDFKTGKNKEEK
jgi:signal transduction histidine kinase